MITDIFAFMVSFIILIFYYLYLKIRLRNNPLYSMQAVNAIARKAWVEKIMSVSGNEILAVQTLRNSTMTATFFASTASLLIIGILNLLARNGDISLEIVHHQVINGDLSKLKLLLLLVDFFLTFVYFSLAVRMYNHVGFLINSASNEYQFITPALVVDFINRGGYYYSLGMHIYYLSLPVLFWMFGPFYMIIASIGVVALLYHSDYGGSQNNKETYSS